MNIAARRLNDELQAKRPLTDAEDKLRTDAALAAMQGLVIAKLFNFADPNTDLVRCWKVADAFVAAKNEV